MARLANIQILRAFAALMVLVSHLGTEFVDIAARRGLDISFNPTPWTSGVDLFFVVSGFIMVVTAGNSFGTPGATGRFLSRRIARVVPLYWLLTTAVLAGGLLAPRLLNVPVVDAWHIVASYLFWPAARATGEIRPVLALGWTLNFEMLFYLLFGLALALPRRWGLAALAGGLLGLVALGQLTQLPGVALPFWASPVLLEFLAGMAVGLLYRPALRLGAWPALMMIGAGLVALLASGSAADHRDQIPAVLTLLVPAALVVACAAAAPDMARGLAGRAIMAVGDASYSLYLVHPFAIRPLHAAWNAADLPLWLFPPAAIALSIGVALALFHAFERPSNSWLSARMSGATAARPTSVQSAV